MKNKFGFALILAVFWLINSGYFKPLLLAFGFLSVAGVVAIAWRMREKDGEFFPVFMPSWRLPAYLFWMMGEIVKANIDVIKRIWLNPSSISPTIVTLRVSQKLEIGKVLYANSITMTPGTVTLSLRDDMIEVHALTHEAAEELQRGEMDRRVTAVENS